MKYTKADDAKIKEYTLAIDKLIKEGIKKKSELDSEITETRAAQIQLDKVSSSFFHFQNQRNCIYLLYRLVKHLKSYIKNVRNSSGTIRFGAVVLLSNILKRQWEEAIDALKKRDEAILAAEEEHEALKKEIGGREEILREKQKFLDEQKANNAQLDTKIAYSDRQLAKVRSHYTTVQASIVEYLIQNHF